MSDLASILKDLPPQYQDYVDKYIYKKPTNQILPSPLHATKHPSLADYCTLRTDCTACQYKVSQSFNEGKDKTNYGGLKKGFLKATNQSSQTELQVRASNEGGKSTSTKSTNCSNSADGVGLPSCAAEHSQKQEKKTCQHDDNVDPVISALDSIYYLMDREPNGVERVKELMFTMLRSIEKAKTCQPSVGDAPDPMDVVAISDDTLGKYIRRIANMKKKFESNPIEVAESFKSNRDIHAILLFMDDAFGEMFEKDENVHNSVDVYKFEDGCDFIFDFLEKKGYRKTVSMILKCFGILKALNSSTVIVSAKREKQKVFIASFLKMRNLFENDPEELYDFSRFHPIWRKLVLSVWLIRCNDTEINKA